MAIYSGFTHEKWWFSIVMWLFTRGYLPKCRKPMKTISPWKWSPLSESLPYLSPTCVSIWKSCGRDWKSWTIGKTCPGDPGWRWGFLDKKNMMKSHDNHKKPRDSIGHSFWPPKPIINRALGGRNTAGETAWPRPTQVIPATTPPWNPSCATKRRLEIVLNSDGSNTKPWLLKRVFNIHFNIRGKWFIII